MDRRVSIYVHKNVNTILEKCPDTREKTTPFKYIISMQYEVICDFPIRFNSFLGYWNRRMTTAQFYEFDKPHGSPNSAVSLRSHQIVYFACGIARAPAINPD